MRRAFRLLAVSLPITLLPLPAGAQTAAPLPSTQTADASGHFDRGTTFYTEGDYAAALIEFRRAYELSPRSQILFNIGQAYFQLRDYANALMTLRRFALEGGDRIGPEDRATLDAELPDLANRVGKVTIACNVDGAMVLVDDEAVGTTPLRDPVLVSAGTRVITATYKGRAQVRQRVPVGGGDSIAVRFEFQPLAASRPSMSRKEGPVQSPPNYAPTYLTFLVAGGGLAMGSIFGVAALRDKSNLDQVCAPSGGCPVTSQSDVNTLSRDGTLSTVGFGIGIAGLAAGIAVWLAAQASSTSSTSPRQRVAEAGGALRSGIAFEPGFVAGCF